VEQDDNAFLDELQAACRESRKRAGVLTKARAVHLFNIAITTGFGRVLLQGARQAKLHAYVDALRAHIAEQTARRLRS
jgi:hypothetical protein